MSITYVSQYGADTGGGYNECGAFSPQLQGQMLAGGDTWGLRYTYTGGNEWWGAMAGITSTDPPPHCRAGFWSQRNLTPSLRVYGTGYNGTSAGHGAIYYGLDHDYSGYVLDSSIGMGLAQGGPGVNNTARRPCGDLIDSYWTGAGTDKEYIFILNQTGLYRYANTTTGGTEATRAAAIGSTKTQLLTTADIGTINRVCVRVLDAQNLLVVNWDHDLSLNPVATDIYLVTTTAGDWSTATSGNTSASLVTKPSSTMRVYDIKWGLDGNLYAACGYAGIYKLTFTGGGSPSVTFGTHLWTPPAGEFCSSADADSAGRVVGVMCGTNGAYNNSSTGLTVGHSVIQSNVAQTTWTYVAQPAAVKFNEFQAGDTTVGTGRLWWLRAQNVVLSQPAHDGSQIRVDPFDDKHIAIFGRSGCWQSRDGGVTWYPAMNGMNGGQTLNGITCSAPAGPLIRTTGPTSFANYNTDYHQSTTTDDYQTATLVSACYTAPAGSTGKRLSQSVPTTFVGDDGATYVFTPAGGSPATLTRDAGSGPVAIHDAKFQGAIIAPVSMAVSSDSTVAILQDGGGVFLLVPVTAPPPSTGSSNLVPPDTTGRLRMVTSLHYYGTNAIVADGTHTAQQNANYLAQNVDVIVSQLNKLGSTNTNASYVPGMYGVNPDLIIIPYGKSIENDLPNTYGFPEVYFAHTAKPGTTANRINVFSANIYMMQADAAGSFNDPRGFTSASWKDWRAQDAQHNISDDNSRLGFTLWKGTYLDSMGAGPSGAVNPSTGAVYAAPAWHAIANTVGDSVSAASPSSQMVIGNGLGDGTKFYSSSSDLINHVNGGLAEGWLRGNAKSNTDTGMNFPTVTQWKQDVQFIIDIEALGKMVWLATNMWNTAANPALTNPSPFSAAQVDQWRQFIAATFLIAKGQYAHFEFVPDNVHIKAYDEIRNNPVYQVNLGAPLETATATGSTLAGATFYRKAGADNAAVVYGRKFANGIALVNPSGTAYNGFTLDRSYKKIDGTPVAATINIPANTGMVLLLAGGGGTVINRTDASQPTTDAHTLSAKGSRTDASQPTQESRTVRVQITRTDSSRTTADVATVTVAGNKLLTASDASNPTIDKITRRTLTLTETGSAADANKNRRNVTDTGTGVDQSHHLLNRTDTGHGADSISHSTRNVTDSGTAVDATGLPVNVTDSAAGTDARTLMATYLLDDEASAVDTSHLAKGGPLFFLTDSAVGTDRSRVVRTGAVSSVQGMKLEITGGFKILVGA